MSIILSLIIDIGCLDPNSNVEAGRVKSWVVKLDLFSELMDFFNSSNFWRVIFFNSFIANPYSFFSEIFTFLNSEKYLFPYHPGRVIGFYLIIQIIAFSHIIHTLPKAVMFKCFQLSIFSYLLKGAKFKIAIFILC